MQCECYEFNVRLSVQGKETVSHIALHSGTFFPQHKNEYAAMNPIYYIYILLCVYVPTTHYIYDFIYKSFLMHE